ncbi:hypothetical protein [Actinomadura chokoriensis]|uniref:Uncharacterized protein n=1 Tax=Actinomadura chokoriensis TaxID=454156 RepID=A0ABV4R2F0_9ACTN
MVDQVAELISEVATLRRAVRNEPLPGAWDHVRDVDRFLRRRVEELHRLPLVAVEHAELDHYGSGYASYIDVFATKRDGSTRQTDEDGGVRIECLNVLLCRLAPIACLLRPDDLWQTHDTSWSPSPNINRVIAAPDQSWADEFHQVKDLLDQRGISLIGPDLLTRPLPEGLEAKSNLANPARTIFDAWFHWPD